ncbi:MAG: hypothetical protein GWM98_21430, partial [Nitrospinaceae bacterium]|nr:hypothetical protein [Nitrospinaceae bacterium]NIS87019.1 hypothetical protein [Nitrospinaceae bacterium]NIT83861.1 hypothetical protein [Nitrospinaceae bacterium]NIU98233.1 hypothetical protein [Nitrospinaceae bacterium]NIW07634.1 hypothetical protein [Nitrospinaceae bacterium]
AFTPEGGLVVADDFNHRIQVYDRDHRPVLTFGQKGNQPGEFHYPKGVTLDAEGNFYVADSWNHRVQKLDPEGRPLLSLGSIGEGKGQLNEPYDVHLDPSGRLIVVERYNHRIQFFTPEGQSLGWVGARGTVLEEELAFIFETPGHLLAPPVFEFPTSLTRDHRGHYYLTDSGNHRIVQFDPHWREIGSFGRRGSGPGRFQYPLWIAAAPNNL